MITVIGSVNMDLVVQTDTFPRQGETTFGQLFTTTPGGKGANQAVAAARLGGNVQMIATVGNDGFGDELKDNLRAEGIDVRHVMQSETTASGIANILLSDGDNRIIVVPGANYDMTSMHITALKEVIENSKLIVLQLEIPIETIETILAVCNELHVPVLLNPAPATGFKLAFMDHVQYLTPNETECAEIFGTDVKSALEQFPNQLIVTLGAAGARYFDGEQHVFIEGYLTDAVDTTGAGDTFNGALAYQIANGAPLADAVRFANAAGSLSVEKFGAQGGMPTIETVEERLQKM